jgi:hypothetical protein
MKPIRSNQHKVKYANEFDDSDEFDDADDSDEFFDSGDDDNDIFAKDMWEFSDAFVHLFFHRPAIAEKTNLRVALHYTKDLLANKMVLSRSGANSGPETRAWCTSLCENLELDLQKLTPSLLLPKVLWYRLAWRFWIKGQRINQEFVRQYATRRDERKDKGFALVVPDTIKNGLTDGTLNIQDVMLRPDCFELDRFMFTETIDRLQETAWRVYYYRPEEVISKSAEAVPAEKPPKRTREETIGKGVIALVDTVLENAVAKNVTGLKADPDLYDEKTHQYSGKPDDLLKLLREDYEKVLKRYRDGSILSALSYRVEWLKP